MNSTYPVSFMWPYLPIKATKEHEVITVLLPARFVTLIWLPNKSKTSQLIQISTIQAQKIT